MPPVEVTETGLGMMLLIVEGGSAGVAVGGFAQTSVVEPDIAGKTKSMTDINRARSEAALRLIVVIYPFLEIKFGLRSWIN